MGFHFSQRHPWTFHSEGLAYPLEQAAAAQDAVMTPGRAGAVLLEIG